MNRCDGCGHPSNHHRLCPALNERARDAIEAVMRETYARLADDPKETR